jgi:hypothetical protein
MNTDVLVWTAIAVGGQMVWYGGGFLPIASIVIQQERSAAVKTFLRWCVIFSLSASVIGLIMYITGPDLYSSVVPLSNNILMIGFGVWMLVRVVRTSTPVEHSKIKLIVFIIALIQAVLIWQATAGMYATTSAPTFVDLVILFICFILSVLIHSAIISFILWIIASTSKTKKLQRYLAGLFSFLCIVIGILNFL